MKIQIDIPAEAREKMEAVQRQALKAQGNCSHEDWLKQSSRFWRKAGIVSRAMEDEKRDPPGPVETKVDRAGCMVSARERTARDRHR